MNQNKSSERWTFFKRCLGAAQTEDYSSHKKFLGFQLQKNPAAIGVVFSPWRYTLLLVSLPFVGRGGVSLISYLINYLYSGRMCVAVLVFLWTSLLIVHFGTYTGYLFRLDAELM